MILDTCALIWLASGSDQLSKAALAAIDAADLVYVSAITAFETHRVSSSACMISRPTTGG